MARRKRIQTRTRKRRLPVAKSSGPAAITTTTPNGLLKTPLVLRALGCGYHVSGVSEAVDLVKDYIRNEQLEHDYGLKSDFVLDPKLQKLFPSKKPFTSLKKSLLRPVVEDLLYSYNGQVNGISCRSSRGTGSSSSSFFNLGVNNPSRGSSPQVEPEVIVIGDSSDSGSEKNNTRSNVLDSDFDSDDCDMPFRAFSSTRRRTRSNVINSDSDDDFNGSETRTRARTRTAVKRKKKAKISVKDDGEVMFEREETLEERLERGFIEAQKNNNVIVL
mmetsp:Transcript_18013/g.23004  ORF Transcript_18013/g.23004 Transcript_18013/m.23004 type:complete len:274 (+) Transcript_18013:503-1324(+)